MQAFLLITGYLVNIRKTYKKFASYTIKILIPHIVFICSIHLGGQITTSIIQR